MKDVILEALLDSIKAFPILLLVYLLIEFLEHKHSVKFEHAISNKKRTGPILGSLIGIIPQCGFSSIMADLYSRKIITIGTLFAVFMATSDEAFAVLLTQPNKIENILTLIIVKLISAIAVGTIIDLIFYKKPTKHNDIDHHEHHEHDCDDCSHNELHHEHELEKDKDSSYKILKEAFKHAFHIFTIILVSNFMLGTLIHLIGIDNIKDFVSPNNYIQYITAPLVGLIPSCAGSVVLVELYTSSIISFSTCLGGLITGTGVGLVVLYKRNKNLKENILITVGLYLIGIIFALLLSLFNI